MEPRVIALMGATGSGKSSMIKLATGIEDIAIGHGLTSETRDITSYPLSFLGYDITLIDTPGFDDTYRSDADILQSIVEWLTRTYQDGTRLSGILYLHRITDVRLQGSALRNLRVFREICGADCFKNVALCPTFWNVAEESDSVLEQRLNELTHSEGYWGGMINCGSKVFKEPVTRNEAINMLYQLVTNDTVTLQIQREVVDERKQLSETCAVATLMKLELDRQRQEHEARHEAMMAEAKRQFEEELQRRERTLSEDLAGMRKLFEDKLATIEDTNQKLRAQVQSQIRRPSGNSIARRPLPQKDSSQMLHRAATTPADQKSLVSQRQQRYHSFVQEVKTAIQHLETEKRFGRVKCNFSEPKICYLMVCTHCLRNIGDDDYYKCVDCSSDFSFILCTQCHYSNTVQCNSSFHCKQDMVKNRALDAIGTTCPRILIPPNSAPSFCRKCGADVGRCYLHCCRCSERFEMCIKCATQGKHCSGHRRVFGSVPHTLEICARYIET